MSETTTAQQQWLHDVLGLDAGGGGQVAKSGGADADGDKQGKGFFQGVSDTMVGAVRSGSAAIGLPVWQVTQKELSAALKELEDDIAAIKKLGFDTKQMTADHADMTKQGATAEKETDKDKAQKALDAVTARVKEMIANAESLLDSTKAVMGDKKGDPDNTQKSAIYKQAIKTLYKLDIEVPEGMTNTHFDKMFDMLGTLPKKDVKQEKFKKLTYSDQTADKNSGAYYKKSGKIEMGDFGDATKTENYTVDGEVIPANSFNVTALHEVGHAVDDKHGVMAKNGSKSGAGGWKAETIDSTAEAFLPEVKKVVPQGNAVADAVLLTAITTALTTGTTSQPTEIDNGSWVPIVEYLTNNCLKIRAANKPWFKGSQIIVDGRVYQQAYSAQWCSYDFAARATTKVNNYQWRAPGEWFAEVYAISWLAKKKPPAGVDGAIAAFMHQG